MNFGVIGLGKISTTFTKEFDFIPDSKIIIAGSRDIEKAKEFCNLYNIPEAGSYEDVINHSGIDAIYIGTPHNSHYELTKAALLAGKHVLCEKSITTDGQQYRELAALAKSKNLFLMDAMWTYLLPPMQQAKKWAVEGKIGKIKLVQIDFSYPAARDFENRIYNPHLAGGALLDIGVYVLYNSFLFLGYDYKTMHCSAEMSPTHIDESVSINFDYGDSKSSLYCSIKHRTISSAYIFGEDGYIIVPLFWKTRSAVRYNNADEIVEEFIDTRLSHGFEFETKHFISCVENGVLDSPILPQSLTQKVMDVMDEVRSKIGLIYPWEK